MVSSPRRFLRSALSLVTSTVIWLAWVMGLHLLWPPIQVEPADYFFERRGLGLVALGLQWEGGYFVGSFPSLLIYAHFRGQRWLSRESVRLFLIWLASGTIYVTADLALSIFRLRASPSAFRSVPHSLSDMAYLVGLLAVSLLVCAKVALVVACPTNSKMPVSVMFRRMSWKTLTLLLALRVAILLPFFVLASLLRQAGFLLNRYTLAYLISHPGLLELHPGSLAFMLENAFTNDPDQLPAFGSIFADFKGERIPIGVPKVVASICTSILHIYLARLIVLSATTQGSNPIGGDGTESFPPAARLDQRHHG
jgi:hypothetical protein